MIGETGDLLGHNMFAYTQNNPVMMVDPSGYFALSLSFGVAAIASIAPFVLPALAVVAFVALVAYVVVNYDEIEAGFKSKLGQYANSSVNDKTAQLENVNSYSITDEYSRRQNQKYFTAHRVFDGLGGVQVGLPITEEQAIMRVKSEKDVYTLYQSNAVSLAIAAGISDYAIDSRGHGTWKYPYNKAHTHALGLEQRAHIFYDIP